MITTLLLYIISFLLGAISFASNFVAGNFSIWPSTVLNGLTYFFSSLMKLDFILNIYQMLTSLKWLIAFLIVWVSIKLLLKLFNFGRGSGEIDI